MTYWPFWLVGLALAGVPLLHWLVLGRMFAVSGRFTAINDKLRARLEGEHDDAAGDAMSTEEMAAALREASVAAFGESAVEESATEAASAAPPPKPLLRAPTPVSQNAFTHVLFLSSLVVGSAISAISAGHFAEAGPPMGALFARIFGDSTVVAAAVLFFGGILVGFGTRMSGGCTSGHGLCGVSRFQPGSLAATASFFGAGIAVSLALGLLVH